MFEIGQISVKTRILILVLTCSLTSLCFYVIFRSSLVNSVLKLQMEKSSNGALYLTPLIKDAKFEEARKLALVGPDYDWFKSYSGYVTVNDKLNSNMFFWYFPPLIAPCDKCPVIIWLQGGPGQSSLNGLLLANGPYELDESGGLRKREYSWAINHHLIYIDNPVGTGFSFTDHEEGYSKNEVQVGQNLYEAVVQIFLLFPELQENKLYVMGESYGGKFSISLAFRIHTEKERERKQGKKPRVRLNLGGVVIGGAFVDPIHQCGYGSYLQNIGLVANIGGNQLEKAEKAVVDLIKNRKLREAHKRYKEFFELIRNHTGYSTFYNFLHANEALSLKRIAEFLQLPKTRENIHVGSLDFHSETKVLEVLESDIMDSVSLWLLQLLSSYRVLVYNGQLDMIVPYLSVRKYFERLKFTNAGSFQNAPRAVWQVDGEIAGYIRHGGFLHEALVKNAGHHVIIDQPKRMFYLISNFTYHGSLFP